MLTTETIKANTTLEGLTDEQVGAIVEMSRNDEASVIGQKTGEIYGSLDADILAASGIAKDGTEKTYAYAKRVIGQLKADGEAARAAAQTAGGGDEQLRSDLAAARAELESVKSSYAALKSESDKAEKKHAKEILGIQIDAELNAALEGMTFKQGLSDAVVAVLKKQAADKVRSLNPEYIDNGAGGKTLTFKGADGTILRNPDTNLNPFTARELLRKELSTMDVLETPRKQTGAGSDTETHTGAGNNAAIDVSGARTQSEAFSLIEGALLRNGLPRGSQKFKAAFDEAWAANKIADLPLK